MRTMERRWNICNLISQIKSKQVEYSIIRSENLKTTRWTGGTSTELFIFPTDSEYQKRNFSFRISTAKVEIEKSEFTSLPGISRKLMVLEGGIFINHEKHHSKQLNKFDVDVFEGDWKTTAVGKCTDFNLMTQGEIRGEISSLIIKKNQSANYRVKDDCDWLFMYIFSGKICLSLNSNEETLNTGYLMVYKNPGKTNLKIMGFENSELVFSEIFKPQ